MVTIYTVACTRYSGKFFVIYFVSEKCVKYNIIIDVYKRYYTKTTLFFVYGHKKRSSKMSSRKLTWHNVDECTYRFGSCPNDHVENPGDRRPAMKSTTKSATTMTKPTTKSATTMKTKTTSVEETKPTTDTTPTSESGDDDDDDERMLQMLHDAIF